MKRTALAVMAVIVLTLLAAPASAAHRNDLRAIQKAVKQNPAYEEGKEVRWFKVLITDSKSKDAKVKITLPIALVDLAMSCSDARHVRFDGHRCDVDLKALWAELKKAGPTALIEVEDDGAIIKVWLE